MLLRRSAGRGAVRCRLAVIAALLVAVANEATADTIELAVHGGTGQVWLYNPNAAPFDFVYYSISSTDSALNPSNGIWTSIADTYDASGDGSVDPASEWTELSRTTTMLAEGTFVGDGGTLAVGQSVSLGAIWSGVGGLTGQVVEATETPMAVDMTVVVTPYDSDFDFDADVDLTDLAIWQANLGSVDVLHTQGDADWDGDVDGDDFLLWQQEVGGGITGSVTGGGASVRAVAAVPEPATLLLVCAGAGAWLLLPSCRRR